MSVRRKDRRHLISNQVFDIYLDHIKDGDVEVSDYLVVQPKTLTQDGVAGVAVLPVCGDRIGLVHVYRHPVDATLWEVPRGFIDQGESVIQAAQRELLEESGLYCESGDLERQGVLAPEPGVMNAKVATLIARRCRREQAVPLDEPDHLGFRLFSVPEVERLIESGEIMDPFTLTLFFRFRARL